MKFYDFLNEGIYEQTPHEILHSLIKKKNDKTSILNKLQNQLSLAKQENNIIKYKNINDTIDLYKLINISIEEEKWTDYYKEIAEKLTDIFDKFKFDEDDEFLIEQFKGSTYNVNNLLRNGNTHKEAVSRSKLKIKEMSKLINKNRLKHDVILYRGISYLHDLKVGDIFTDKGFVSTSYIKDLAETFSINVIFEIHCKKGQKALYLDFIDTRNKYECEFLLPPNSKFKIIDIQDAKTKIYTNRIKYIVEYLGDE